MKPITLRAVRYAMNNGPGSWSYSLRYTRNQGRGFGIYSQADIDRHNRLCRMARPLIERRRNRICTVGLVVIVILSIATVITTFTTIIIALKP